MNIPMVNLKEQYAQLAGEFDAALRTTLDSTQYILGANVQSFEAEVETYANVKHAIGVASGTDALHLALRAAGVSEGDEVITTAFTFIGTAEAISYCGAKPVFVDVDPITFNMDLEQISAAITPKTKAVLVVHVFGQPLDLDPLLSLCRKRDLLLVEDCAHAFGADYKGKKVGSVGDFGCFSFYPSKNLGAFGDGGMVTCNNDVYAEKIRMLRNHGSNKPQIHELLGYNSRLDDMQAAILRVKLKYIDTFNDLRRKNARAYTSRLYDADIITPENGETGTHVYHQYTIQSKKRDLMREALTKKGIACSIFYVTPVHRQPVYADQYKDLDLPVVEKLSTQVLSLPMCPYLTETQVEQVCDTLLEAI